MSSLMDWEVTRSGKNMYCPSWIFINPNHGLFQLDIRHLLQIHSEPEYSIAVRIANGYTSGKCMPDS